MFLKHVQNFDMYCWMIYESEIIKMVENLVLTNQNLQRLERRRVINVSLKVMKSLEKVGIETRPAFIPIHKLPPYAKFNHLDLPNTQYISKYGLSLPTSSVMSDSDVKFVAQSLKEIISR
jgi:dTDP-4-amino-4,6-dideoxygalactose transaminase